MGMGIAATIALKHLIGQSEEKNSLIDQKFEAFVATIRLHLIYIHILYNKLERMRHK